MVGGDVVVVVECSGVVSVVVTGHKAGDISDSGSPDMEVFKDFTIKMLRTSSNNYNPNSVRWELVQGAHKPTNLTLNSYDKLITQIFKGGVDYSILLDFFFLAL